MSSDDNSGNHNSNEHQRNIAPVAVNHKGSRDYRADNRAYGNHFCYCNKNNRTTDSNEQLNRGQHKQTAKRDRNAFPSAELIKNRQQMPEYRTQQPYAAEYSAQIFGHDIIRKQCRSNCRSGVTHADACRTLRTVARQTDKPPFPAEGSQYIC